MSTWSMPICWPRTAACASSSPPCPPRARCTQIHRSLIIIVGFPVGGSNEPPFCAEVALRWSFGAEVAQTHFMMLTGHMYMQPHACGAAPGKVCRKSGESVLRVRRCLYWLAQLCNLDSWAAALSANTFLGSNWAHGFIPDTAQWLQSLGRAELAAHRAGQQRHALQRRDRQGQAHLSDGHREGLCSLPHAHRHL